MSEAPVRGQILQQAMDATLKARNEVYGDPFKDMNCAAQMVAVYRQHAGNKYCPAHDEAIERVFMKLARIACGAPGHADSYVDAAAYMAIAAECQSVKDGRHWSDCALHNGPAMEPGNCSCGVDPLMTPEAYGSERPAKEIYAKDWQYKAYEIKPVVGTRFYFTDDPVQAIYEIVEPISPAWVAFKLEKDGLLQYITMEEFRSKTTLYPIKPKSSHRCFHCPNDVEPGRALCDTCAEEVDNA